MRKLTSWAFKISLAAILIHAATGCRGIQSELQKSEISDARTNAVCKEGEVRMSASLKKFKVSGLEGFDLEGRIIISAASGAMPPTINIYQLGLKPSWKGWPGYFVMNAQKRKDGWVMGGLLDPPDTSFKGTSQMKDGSFIIDFVWREQGVRGKPEHFEAYDVTVNFRDSTGKRYVMACMAVPAP
jgi:hypothetical protein